MSDPTLQERMAALEKQLSERMTTLEQHLAELTAQVQELAQPKDWRRTIGMFADDEFMKRIDEAGRKIREKDRERAKKALDKERRRSKRW